MSLIFSPNFPHFDPPGNDIAFMSRAVPFLVKKFDVFPPPGSLRASLSSFFGDCPQLRHAPSPSHSFHFLCLSLPFLVVYTLRNSLTSLELFSYFCHVDPREYALIQFPAKAFFSPPWSFPPRHCSESPLSPFAGWISPKVLLNCVLCCSDHRNPLFLNSFLFKVVISLFPLLLRSERVFL